LAKRKRLKKQKKGINGRCRTNANSLVLCFPFFCTFCLGFTGLLFSLGDNHIPLLLGFKKRAEFTGDRIPTLSLLSTTGTFHQQLSPGKKIGGLKLQSHRKMKTIHNCNHNTRLTLIVGEKVSFQQFIQA
jgi:hypothetical protein